ncbi:hypothetical protein BS78_03G039400 [Paspalum vaginatum]|nr:hypothetical protein BS78_03G039400 [Paspalum vaginatum]
MEHVPEDYRDDAPDEHGIPPTTYQALERHLPHGVRDGPRDRKLAVMRRILHGLHGLHPLSPLNNAVRIYVHGWIHRLSPLHHELYTMDPSAFFIPSFLEAIRSNSRDGFRSIMTEPTPGLFVFDMLRPAFCQMLAAEADNFLWWAPERKQGIIRPTTNDQYKCSVVLSEFGLETMLSDLMNDFISPIATVLYPELGASSFDSHHSFVTWFDKGQGEVTGSHVDGSEVTLSACIRQEFTGGEMYFRGVRCTDHVHSETHNEENIVHSQTLGQAMLYRGRHRHGALPTSSGYKTTFEIWCISSLFRRMLDYQTDFTSWCGECRTENI